jgi:hypothetical protein
VIAPDVFALLLDTLADRIAARIGATHERQTYSSTALPANCTRRRFAELCRSGRVIGARRDGSIWVCSRVSWEAARRRSPRANDLAAPTTSTRERVDDLLRRNGLRIAK